MQKPILFLSKTHYKGQEILLVGFKYNLELKEYLKKFSGIRWSTSLKSFYLLFDKEVTNHLFKYLRAKGYYVDYSALKTKKTSVELKSTAKKVNVGVQISTRVKDSIHQFSKWMAQMRYSENTINTYESMLLIFFRFQHPKAIADITQRDILNFNTDYIMANGYSYTYQNQAINAIKLFYKRVDNTLLIPEALERPKKSRKLPEVLSINEVKLILSHTPNLKHKTLLSLLYSCGLRIGEALKLKITDIDMERRFMHIKSAKGAKDRYVPVPEQMIRLLKKYTESYNPEYLVFEGQNGGMYTAVSARQVLKRSLKRVGIKNPLHYILCAIVMQPICWKMGQT